MEMENLFDVESPTKVYMSVSEVLYRVYTHASMNINFIEPVVRPVIFLEYRFYGCTDIGISSADMVLSLSVCIFPFGMRAVFILHMQNFIALCCSTYAHIPGVPF